MDYEQSSAKARLLAASTLSFKGVELKVREPIKAAPRNKRVLILRNFVGTGDDPECVQLYVENCLALSESGDSPTPSIVAVKRCGLPTSLNTYIVELDADVNIKHFKYDFMTHDIEVWELTKIVQEISSVLFLLYLSIVIN